MVLRQTISCQYGINEQPPESCNLPGASVTVLCNNGICNKTSTINNTIQATSEGGTQTVSCQYGINEQPPDSCNLPNASVTVSCDNGICNKTSTINNTVQSTSTTRPKIVNKHTEESESANASKKDTSQELKTESSGYSWLFLLLIIIVFLGLVGTGLYFLKYKKKSK